MTSRDERVTGWSDGRRAQRLRQPGVAPAPLLVTAEVVGGSEQLQEPFERVGDGQGALDDVGVGGRQPAAQPLQRAAQPQEAAPAGSRAHELQHGWFVGHVSRGDREYVLVTAYSNRVEPADSRPAGWVARDMTKRILAPLGLY